jgi:methyl-accepting chemotaxis protein
MIDTTRTTSDWIIEAQRVCEAASKGDLEARVLNIDNDNEAAPMLHAINHMLDMTDAFVREATASLSYASQKKFFRRVLPEGLLGTFRNASVIINSATAQMDRESQELEESRKKQAELQEQERRAAEILRTKVDELLVVARAAGNGDLTPTINHEGDEAMDQLAEGFDRMIVSISEALSNVGDSSAQIDQGSQQIAAASQSLAEGASQQAANLEQINASLEEMSAMTTTNAQNTQEVARLSQDSQLSAGRGQEEMTLMNDAMEEIKRSSAEISKIIKVIDEIAFQTNLLALNAGLRRRRRGGAKPRATLRRGRQEHRRHHRGLGQMRRQRCRHRERRGQRARRNRRGHNKGQRAARRYRQGLSRARRRLRSDRPRRRRARQGHPAERRQRRATRRLRHADSRPGRQPPERDLAIPAPRPPGTPSAEHRRLNHLSHRIA